MVSAYPGLFYPGQVYPSQVDTVPPPPPVNADDTDWGSWILTRTGAWVRRSTRVLTWTGSPTGPGWDIYDGSTGTDIYDGSTGTTIYDFRWPQPAGVPIFDGNGTVDILDGGGTTSNLYDGNG
jgi:hypothetical protein